MTDSEAEYRVYTDHKRGSLNPNLNWYGKALCMPDSASLADVIESHDQMEIVTRHDAQDDVDEGNCSDDECDGVEES